MEGAEVHGQFIKVKLARPGKTASLSSDIPVWETGAFSSMGVWLPSCCPVGSSCSLFYASEPHEERQLTPCYLARPPPPALNADEYQRKYVFGEKDADEEGEGEGEAAAAAAAANPDGAEKPAKRQRVE